jgi:hypothetical protein
LYRLNNFALHLLSQESHHPDLCTCIVLSHIDLGLVIWLALVIGTLARFNKSLYIGACHLLNILCHQNRSLSSQLGHYMERDAHLDINCFALSSEITYMWLKPSNYQLQLDIQMTEFMWITHARPAEEPISWTKLKLNAHDQIILFKPLNIEVVCCNNRFSVQEWNIFQFSLKLQCWNGWRHLHPSIYCHFNDYLKSIFIVKACWIYLKTNSFSPKDLIIF